MDDTSPFGTYTPDFTAKICVGTFDFDRPHKAWPLIRKLSKRWIRNSGRFFDLKYRGFKLRLHPATNVGDEAIVLHGIHGEEDEFKRVETLIHQFENFIDIGANIGLYSLIAARHLPETRPIVAFEPMKNTLQRLNANLKLNDVHRVHVINAAVSDANGVLELYQPPANLGGTSNVKRYQNWAPSKVEKTTLKDALAALGIDRIGMLKVDIEGAEDAAILPYIDSMPRSSWPKYILAETCHQRNWNRDLEVELLNHGYRCVYENRRNKHFAMPVEDQ